MKTTFRSFIPVAVIVSLFLMISCEQPESEPQVLVVDDVYLDITKAELIPGDTVRLTATLLPFNKTVDEAVLWSEDIKDAVYWRSDNPKVAQVDDRGLVTAKAPGTCVVSFMCGALLAECKVIVRYYDQDILYGLWEMSSLIEDKPQYSFLYDNTGFIDGKPFDWSFDGMRLSFTLSGIPVPEAERTMIITAVSSGIIYFYYADEGDSRLRSMKKIPMPLTPEQTAACQNDTVADLGLPSGILWATCNLGAELPELEGFKYAWAENAAKDTFLLDNYKWYDTSAFEMTKYAADNITVFEAADDPATNLPGGAWRTPSAAEVTELVENCNIYYSSLSGRNGVLFIPKNKEYAGRCLFIPFTQSVNNSTTMYETGSGYYWTSSLSTDNPFEAKGMYISYDNGNVKTYGGLCTSRRFNGMCIRPVLMQKK